MKATDSGKIIGYAMESCDFKDNNVEEVLVFVNAGYYVSGEDRQCREKIKELELRIAALESR